MSDGFCDLLTPWSSTSHSPADRSVDEEITKLYVTYAKALTQHLISEFGRDHAEEATNEAFLQMYQRRLSGTVIDTPKGWLSAVARRLLINRAKADGRYALPLQSDYDGASLEPTTEEIWIDRERVLLASIGIRELSGIERRRLTLRARGLKLREIAELLMTEAPELGQVDHQRVSEIITRAVRYVRQRIEQ